jgi:NifB/MoaA-like Fe-S oxidoreductase
VPAKLRGKRLVFVTGMLAAPFIEEAADLLRRRGVAVAVVPVENGLFGLSVTVSGLLSGHDIICALKEAERADVVVLPPNLTNPDGLTLDGLELDDMAALAGMPVVAADYDFKVTMKRIRDAC